MADNHGDTSAMLKPRRLLNGPITYSAAKESEANVLHELGYWDQQTEFLTYLYHNRDLIKSIVAQHIGTSAKNIHVAEPDQWMRGSFNICILVDFDVPGQNKQLIIRFPLPYRIGDIHYPGNADEKIMCEAGTYAWLQTNCPDVPIPYLYGFGLRSGKTFTSLDNRPFFPRLLEKFRRRILEWFSYTSPSRYIPLSNISSLSTGYLLIEYIKPCRGKMLSTSWEEGRHDPKLRKNLFHSLSRTLLALARTPLPKIGSFILDEGGYLQLENRPLTLQIQQLENEQIPVDIPRDWTYTSVDSYIHGILSFHENRLRYQPNSVQNFGDGMYQTSALTMMRSTWPCYFDNRFLRGPFFLTLTDIHPSNIFVDDEWNIQCFIDLEWACSRPLEMVHPPYWLSNQAIDMVDMKDYEILHKEFMTALEVEETTLTSPPFLHPAMQQSWDKGTFWFSLALHSPTALFKIFYDYIQPRFSKADSGDTKFWVVTAPYWTFDALKFIDQKVNDKEQYDIALQEEFKV